MLRISARQLEKTGAHGTKTRCALRQTSSSGLLTTCSMPWSLSRVTLPFKTILAQATSCKCFGQHLTCSTTIKLINWTKLLKTVSRFWQKEFNCSSLKNLWPRIKLKKFWATLRGPFSATCNSTWPACAWKSNSQEWSALKFSRRRLKWLKSATWKATAKRSLSRDALQPLKKFSLERLQLMAIKKKSRKQMTTKRRLWTPTTLSMGWSNVWLS